MLYCIYCMLAFGQYLKHSSHSALELIISELNPKVVTRFLIYMKTVKVYHYLVNNSFVLVEAKGLPLVSHNC